MGGKKGRRGTWIERGVKKSRDKKITEGGWREKARNEEIKAGY